MSDAELRIRSILDQLQDAVGAKDLDALSAIFNDDIVLFGTAAANMNRHETTSYLAQVIAQAGTIRWEWDTVVPLVDELGLLVFAVVGTVGLEDSAGRPDGQRDAFRLTGVAVQHGAHWRLSHFHGSVPQQD
jgi:ketosteroid isomerase-like protein